jgi:hypothetical protein
MKILNDKDCPRSQPLCTKFEIGDKINIIRYWNASKSTNINLI